MITGVGVLLPNLVEVAAAVFVLVMAQTRATGTARTSGVLGAVFMIAGVVVPAVFNLVLASRMAMAALTTSYTLLFTQQVIRVALLAAGLLLLARCVVLSNRPSGENPRWQGNQPTPPPYQPGPPAAGPNPYGPDLRQ